MPSRVAPARSNFGRRALKYILALSLAGGIIGLAAKLSERQTRLPQQEPQISADCSSVANRCLLDLRSDLNLKNIPPHIGIEKGCGAKLVDTQLLNDNLVRFQLDITNLTDCDLKFILGDAEYTYPDALKR